jgi:thiol-disulfide isomerase/thioredoxin
MNRFWATNWIKPSWPAFVPVRGAIQDKGFYLQFPTTYPWSIRVVYGISSSNYWSVDDRSVGSAAMEGAPGASPNNADEIRAHRNKALLERILLLGIEDAVPGSLQFTSETNFVARINRNSGRLLEGQFILDAAGIPTKAEYHDQRSSAELQCDVSYIYSPQNPAFPPSQVIAYRRQKGESKTLTNIIDSIQTGFDKAASNGYTADLFLTPITTTRDIYTWSNGVRYLATSEGQLLVDIGKPLPEGAKRVAERIHQKQQGNKSSFNNAAGEFPVSWTWDEEASVRSAHAKLEGTKMPALDVVDWQNGQVKPEQLKGKVVLVDFYATWCGPCIAAIPHNNELLKKYRDKGLMIVGVCTSGRGQEKMEQAVKDKGMQYPTARDPQLKSAKAWAVSYYPTYALVDRNGIVRIIGLQLDHVEPVVQKLLAEHVIPPR